MKQFLLGTIVALFAVNVNAAEEYLSNYLCMYSQDAQKTEAGAIAFYSQDEAQYHLLGLGIGFEFGSNGYCSSMAGEVTNTLIQSSFKGMSPINEDDYIDSASCKYPGKVAEEVRTETAMSEGQYGSLIAETGSNNRLLFYHYVPTKTELAKWEQAEDDSMFSYHLKKKCIELVPGSEPMPEPTKARIIKEMNISIRAQ